MLIIEEGVVDVELEKYAVTIDEASRGERGARGENIRDSFIQ